MISLAGDEAKEPGVQLASKMIPQFCFMQELKQEPVEIDPVLWGLVLPGSRASPVIKVSIRWSSVACALSISREYLELKPGGVFEVIMECYQHNLHVISRVAKRNYNLDAYRAKSKQPHCVRLLDHQLKSLDFADVEQVISNNGETCSLSCTWRICSDKN